MDRLCLCSLNVRYSIGSCKFLPQDINCDLKMYTDFCVVTEFIKTTAKQYVILFGRLTWNIAKKAGNTQISGCSVVIFSSFT